MSEQDLSYKQPSPPFAGQVAVITGAGRGIGAAIAARLSAGGAAVVINDVDPAPAEETAAWIRSNGGQSAVAIANIAKPEEAARVIQTAVDRWGRLDILVNNAGLTRDAMIHRMTDDQYDLVMDVVLRGAFNCTRAASPWLRDAGKADREAGRRVHRKVVNIASIAGIYGMVGNANYGAAKAGLIGLTRSLAREWAPYLVNVNAVAPGLVETRLSAPRQNGAPHGIPSDIRSQLIQRIPLGRSGQPEDIAGAVAFLAGPDSDWITGQVLEVHGGLEIASVVG